MPTRFIQLVPSTMPMNDHQYGLRLGVEAGRYLEKSEAYGAQLEVKEKMIMNSSPIAVHNLLPCTVVVWLGPKPCVRAVMVRTRNTSANAMDMYRSTAWTRL